MAALGIWKLVGWLVFALVQRRVALAGDLDRERATATLKDHYAGGQLTLDEFSRRTGRVLSARSRWQVERALFGLSRPTLADSFLVSLRDLVVVVVTGAYVVFSLALALALGLTTLFAGFSASAFVVIGLVWLIPTLLFVRLRQRSHTGSLTSLH